jgi:hypothetical protein
MGFCFLLDAQNASSQRFYDRLLFPCWSTETLLRRPGKTTSRLQSEPTPKEYDALVGL